MDRKRSDIITAHWLENGDLRFYLMNDKMGGGTRTCVQPLSQSSGDNRNSARK